MDRNEWKSVVSEIAAAARAPQWRLEAFFQVGDGTGRVWRSWVSGKRCPALEKQARVISAAVEIGWLPPDQGIAVPKKKVKATAPATKETKQAAKAWSFIIYSIGEAADKELGQHLSPAQLEKIFKVGNGAGRVWRSWLNGKRLALSVTRQVVEEKAIAKGWLDLPAVQQKHLDMLHDEELASLPHASAAPLAYLPDPPDKDFRHVKMSARLAAAALIYDAFYRRNDGKLGGWREKIIKLGFADGKDWLEAIGKLQDWMENEEREEEKDIGSLTSVDREKIRLKTRAKRIDKLRVQLIAGYRRQGYL